jgi:regulator of RNase E activity RraA
MTSPIGSLSADTLDRLRHATTATPAGEILLARLQARGAAGFVADGGLRDWEPARALGFPVYALGAAAPAHVARHLAIDADVPIACAEVLVLPGDVLVGDGDGVVCVPRALADAVAAEALEQDGLEAFVLDRIKRGAPLPGTYPPNDATRAEYEAFRRATPKGPR